MFISITNSRYFLFILYIHDTVLRVWTETGPLWTGEFSPEGCSLTHDDDDDDKNDDPPMLRSQLCSVACSKQTSCMRRDVGRALPTKCDLREWVCLLCFRVYMVVFGSCIFVYYVYRCLQYAKRKCVTTTSNELNDDGADGVAAYGTPDVFYDIIRSCRFSA